MAAAEAELAYYLRLASARSNRKWRVWGAYGGGLLAALDGPGGAGLASLEGGGDRKEGGGSDGQSNGAGERHVERGGWVLEG